MLRVKNALATIAILAVLLIPLLASAAAPQAAPAATARAAATTAQPSRAVAITIDDLPRGGDKGPRDLASLTAMTAKLLQPFREQRIPVIGFVNGDRYANDEAGLRKLLNQWLDAGADLGNHSYSHP